MMLHLAAANSGGQCLFRRTGADWISTGLRFQIVRGSCLTRSPPPKTLILRSSTIAVTFLPQRWLTKEPLPMKGFTAKHKRDKVPTTFALIYRKYMADKLLLMFYGVSVGFAFLIGSVYFSVMNAMDYDNKNLVEIPKTGLSVKAYKLHYGLIAAVVMSWPFFIHVKFLRSSIIRIYYNSDTQVYVGILKNNFRKKKVEFSLKDIEPVLDRGSGNTNNIVIKGKAYTLFEPDFIDSSYVNHLMRYY